ncbi:MAG: AmmeMemoRadiSam system protein A [Planctomycetota bacterium]
MTIAGESANGEAEGVVEGLRAAEHQALLEHCARYVRWRLQRGAPAASPPAWLLSREGGCFVTWKTHPEGELRGCIGRIHSAGRSLVEVAQEMAISAARADPRFPPIELEELPRLSLSVTVIGDCRPWPCPRDPGEIALGREGLIVRIEGEGGVLLPQVAIEWGYDGRAFLEATCLKASLDRGAWRRPDVEVSRFEAWERQAPYRELAGTLAQE